MNDTEILELRRRFDNLSRRRPVTEEAIQRIEDLLGIVLPLDVKQIASFSDGVFRYSHQEFAFDYQGDYWHVVGKTKEYRESCRLPGRFVALAEPQGESIILLDCGSTSPTNGHVFWIEGGNFLELCEGKSWKPISEWVTYGGFFAEMLSESEE